MNIISKIVIQQSKYGIIVYDEVTKDRIDTFNLDQKEEVLNLVKLMLLSPKED